MLYHLTVLLINVVCRLGVSLWMTYKVIGGVPSFVVVFSDIDYTLIREINT